MPIKVGSRHHLADLWNRGGPSAHLEFSDEGGTSPGSDPAISVRLTLAVC